MTTSNELSELQAVDFAVGSFIAEAFTGLSLTTGPKEWREFLGRTKSAQVYRHDAATPGDFVKALQASRKAETGPTTQKSNAPKLPAVYYFRKPGFANVNDRSKNRTAKYAMNDDMTQAYSLKVLYLDLDYTIVFTAWDKPTLDKLCMAWYAYITGNDKTVAIYQIGEDLFEAPVFFADNCNLTISDSSEPVENGRLFAATAPYNIQTQVIFGAEVPMPPANVRIKYGVGESDPFLADIGIGDGVETVFAWDALADLAHGAIGILNLDLFLDGVRLARWNGMKLVSLDEDYTVTGEMVLCKPLSLTVSPDLAIDDDSVVLIDLTTGFLTKDSAEIAIWDGGAWVSSDGMHDVSGDFFPCFTSLSFEITPAPAEGAAVSISLNMEGNITFGSGCPSCHQYPPMDKA